jgi:alkylation response protein AidB-like acyl-CoA dehydrogenase
MDFAWAPEHVRYRQRIRDLLERHLPPDWPRLSNGYDTSCEYTQQFARKFCPALAAEGLLIPHWAKEHGGGGVDAWHHWVLNEEMWANGEPRCYQYMSVNWAGPSIIKYGTPEQKAYHLPRITGGTIFYCQGFSEPNAGSDLASLRTKAEKTDKGYVINGQKIWTSAASFADFCVLLARTGGGEKKSITVFLVPMNSPGIKVRVIPGLQGKYSLHEVFWDNVEVPASAVLGIPDKGWEVVTAILHNERVGAPRYALTERGLQHAEAVLKERGQLNDPIIRARAARCHALIEASRLQCLKVIGGRVRGEPPSADTNTARYSIVYADRAVTEFIGDFLQDLLISNEDPVILGAYRRSAAGGIAAGSAEIQLNLIAKNLLELPKAA